jgi:multiple sugar transport system permease protein
MTGAAVSTIPLIIFFIIFQKQIVKGIAMSGLKG